MNLPFLTPDLHPEFLLRISKIRKGMKEGQAILVAGNTNIYYTSGCLFRGYVFIPFEGETLFFVIRPMDVEAAESVIFIHKPEQIASILSDRNVKDIKSLGLEMDTLSYNEVERLAKAFPGVETFDASGILREARMVKTDYEIEKMRRDGMHQAAVYHAVPHLYKEDMTDVEFQIEIERALRREGCLGFVRTAGKLMEINLGSVISGANADAPSPYDFSMGGAGTDPSLPVGADGSIMHPGCCVMVDMNGTFNGYQTDMTRVWRIGEIPELAYKAHQCSRDILRLLEEKGVPGVECSELYHLAASLVKERGLEDYFMGHRQHASFIGHGVGIELNEQPVLSPRSKQRLLENMTIAIEPKFVIPKVGAVGVENTYRVTQKGLENLTVFPEEIEEI